MSQKEDVSTLFRRGKVRLFRAGFGGYATRRAIRHSRYSSWSPPAVASACLRTFEGDPLDQDNDLGQQNLAAEALNRCLQTCR